MGEVGRRMPVEFRETAPGGLAATAAGIAAAIICGFLAALFTRPDYRSLRK